MVLWLPYVGVAPDEFLMARLGETDVWYKTIKVDRKMRLAYTLAPNAARLHGTLRRLPCQSIPPSGSL